jgi:hypothetical protein
MNKNWKLILFIRKGAFMKTVMIQTRSRCGLLFLIIFILLGFPGTQAQSIQRESAIFSIDGSVPAAVPETGYLQMGGSDAGKSPDGHQLTVNSRYWMLDGTPWLPVMGEFHYNRYPEKYWEEEILKMKAGGIQIIATYVFWIHHEEVEGQFDWSGQRNLRGFAELCAKHGLYIYPRIGPWGHGEVRNGGLPDWLLSKCQTRVNDSTYLSYVRKFYNEIGKQLYGLIWKEGGPVVGIQIENEYSDRSSNGGAAHIVRLKSMAIEAGFDVPIYTITGWDNAVVPPQLVIPVFGGYPDEPWSGSKEDLPPDPQHVYQFHATPISETGILQGFSPASSEVELWHYPIFTAELGAGMQLTYHRRVQVSEDDITPIALTSIGSGANLLGYYMFHGGANPGGKRTTLQESQATGYPNDVPIVSYDFQAPLREFGQMNGSFRKLKVFHQFIKDFGTDLAPMTTVLPNVVPSGQRDTSTLRISARVAGNKGFLFFNNYLRNYPLPDQKGIQVIVKLQSGTLRLPRNPIDIPSQSCFYWPMNMDLNGAILTHATAQPFTKIDFRDTGYYFFMISPGIPAEFAFVDSTVQSFHSNTGDVSRKDKQVYVNGAEPSTKTAMEFRTLTGKSVRIILLSQQQAYNSWKVPIGRTDHLLITPADVFADKETIHLRSRDPDAFSFSIIPSIDEKTVSPFSLKKTGKDGAFDHFTASVHEKKIPVLIKQICKPAQTPPVRMGIAFDFRNGSVATLPDDSTFTKAGIWRVELPMGMPSGLSDVFLDINYTGDVGRLYDGTHLLGDNFFNGTTWEVGLKRFAPDVFSNGVDLLILPLRKDAPIYIPRSSWPDFKETTQIAQVNSIKASPEYEVKLILNND